MSDTAKTCSARAFIAGLGPCITALARIICTFVLAGITIQALNPLVVRIGRWADPLVSTSVAYNGPAAAEHMLLGWLCVYMAGALVLVTGMISVWAGRRVCNAGVKRLAEGESHNE